MQTETHGGDIYSTPCRMDYSANINPLGMPDTVRRAAEEGIRRSANYPDIHCRSLKRALAEHEKNGITPEDIICGSGAAELIFALALSLRPKKALLTAPGFAEYEQALQAAGSEIEFYPLKPENGFILDNHYLDRLTPDIDMIFLCNPNNPTGLLIPQDLLEQILAACRENHILLVMDECFVDLLENPEAVTLKSRLLAYPNLFILKAFTKLYAMAGLRLGYGLTTNRSLLAGMHTVLQPWNVSIPAQLAGEAALNEQDFVLRTRELIAGERAFLVQELSAMGLKVYPGKANFLFFEGPKELYDRCRAEGVLIRDCSNYRGLGPGYFRIAVRGREENLRLTALLKQLIN